jgi:hypothetical protein
LQEQRRKESLAAQIDGLSALLGEASTADTARQSQWPPITAELAAQYSHYWHSLSPARQQVRNGCHSLPFLLLLRSCQRL